MPPSELVGMQLGMRHQQHRRTPTCVDTAGEPAVAASGSWATKEHAKNNEDVTHDSHRRIDGQHYVNKLEVTEMKMCSWAYGHTLRDHVRNDDTRERFRVDNITERYRHAWLGWFGHVKRETKNTSEERPGEESEEDRSRDGLTVSTGRWEPSRRRPWQNWLEEKCVCRSDPTTKLERLEEKGE